MRSARSCTCWDSLYPTAPGGGPPRFGGIIYTESAEKVAYFIETCNRHKTPLLFIQDVSGFMVGPDAEHSGIIRAGAKFVEAMATAIVPKSVLTVNHASGAGYYAMAGQGFDPDFIYSWPTGRMGVMEGDSAVQAVFGSQLDKLKKVGELRSASRMRRKAPPLLPVNPSSPCRAIGRPPTVAATLVWLNVVLIRPSSAG